MPRITDLRAFCLVVEHKSFSRAAERLKLSQPAVSMQIKSLENNYGDELLHRKGVDILPTESGKLVYDFARLTIDLNDKTQQKINELNASMHGSLRIGASAGPGERVLPVLLGKFKGTYPDIEIILGIGDSSETIDHVLKRRYDLGFVGMSRQEY